MISILIADDHSIVRSGIKLLINSQPDMKVLYEAEDGEEAVQLALAHNPDVVILDLNMPKKSGLLSAKQITESNSDIKIIALTMHEEKEYVIQMLQAGASGYILKSHSEDDLLDAIRAVHKGEVFLYPHATKWLLEDYLNKSSSPAEEELIQTLTGREDEILSLLAQGYTNREISEKLYLSIKTVEAHKSKIMEKLNLKSRPDIIKYAIRKGLLDFI